MKYISLAICFLLLCQLFPHPSAGQQFYRLKADFSIKEKSADGASKLIMGKVYYDKVSKKIVYDITFPEAETWVFQDTVFYRFKDSKAFSKLKSFLAPEFSIFHFALNGQLADYGLKNSFYHIEKVEKERDMVISTWQPDAGFKKVLGKVLMSNVNKKLNGVIFYTTTDEILSKQLYQNYINVSGCEFPTKVIQITYLSSGQNYQVTTYKNITINQSGEENIYNYDVTE